MMEDEINSFFNLIFFYVEFVKPTNIPVKELFS